MVGPAGHGDYLVVVRMPGERDVSITIKPLAHKFPTIHLAKNNSVVRGVRIAVDPNATAPL